eukprot:CAMPEP_0113273780 /NCGR_PEP_ID=MMETSP0008_2-20120614/24042_1 /TAXON_ID=97485 /ORGANISM="Prymnesium parvum" /LENGTH=163 /DNA_ID=CAMNT_0000123337 /DNA_START=359 /DNA_END=847 /DNA_ORIENTATION=- /assembly_acc=CAM_ASM_000153
MRQNPVRAALRQLSLDHLTAHGEDDRPLERLDQADDANDRHRHQDAVLAPTEGAAAPVEGARRRAEHQPVRVWDDAAEAEGVRAAALNAALLAPLVGRPRAEVRPAALERSVLARVPLGVPAQVRRVPRVRAQLRLPRGGGGVARLHAVRRLHRPDGVGDEDG